MKLLIDGKPVNADDLIIIVEDVNLDDDETGQIHLKITYEGIITDIWNEDCSQNVTTKSQTFQELADTLL